MEGFKHYRPSSEKLDPFHLKKYDVFLSFRGPDVRSALAIKLFESLQRGRFHVFLDSVKLEKGEDIGIGLEEAIKDSRVHIPIFSRRYASSAWCLRELSLMWHCKAKGAGNKIIPLFYDVEPGHVRYPESEKSPYCEAFNRHRSQGRHSQEEIEEWKKALFGVSSLLGWGLAQTASGDEDKLVQKITDDLQRYIIKSLHVPKYLVGPATRSIEVVKEYLGADNHQGRITIGIWGMGGSGKTTLSKLIYNHIHHKFQACCFVADIRATARESMKGLRKLQKYVLKNLVKHNEDLSSVDEGKIEMQNRLASIRALVVLDDVDDDDHLDALLGDWYGPGSIIIITTRDRNVLQRRRVDKIQDMEGLSPEEGVKLFSWHAFGKESPEKDYEDMTKQIVHACDSLPLSLEILGAHLLEERNLRIWREALQKMQNVGYDKLYKCLRISFDALNFHEKEMFLDIACFFIVISNNSWFSKEFYIKFWEVLGRKTVFTALRNLEAKSLIVMEESEYKFIRHDNIKCKFRMHDHLRDFGRQIVEEHSPDKPIRSRLWRTEDIISAIAQPEETSTVQGIMWRGRFDDKVEQVDSLASMHNLKFMFCWDLFLKREITKLPQNLIYLVLSGCKVKEHRSFSEILGYGRSCFSEPMVIGQLKYLRYLDMSRTSLGFLPIEFGELLSLEELDLRSCSLIELPCSFGNLINLKFLNISQNALKSFPANFSQLINLKFLNISHNGLKSFPANFSQLRSLEYLDASDNEFEELPTLSEGLTHLDVSSCNHLQQLSPISHLTNLHNIGLYECKNLKELPILPRSLTSLFLVRCHDLQRMSCMHHMENLESIELRECPILGELPDLEALQSLTKLSLDGCENLKELPLLPRSLTSLILEQCQILGELPDLEALQSLTYLSLEECKNLKELPLLPRSLTSLFLYKCDDLQRMSCMRHMENLESIELWQCPILGELPDLEALKSLRKLTLKGCENLEKLPALPEGPITVKMEDCFKLQKRRCS